METPAISRCCGIDVGGRTIIACIREDGKDEVRTFRRSPNDVRQLLAWVNSRGAENAICAVTDDPLDAYWALLCDMVEQQKLTAQVVSPEALHSAAGRRGTRAQRLVELTSQKHLETVPMPTRQERELQQLRDQRLYFQKMLDEQIRERKRVFGRVRTQLSMLIPDVRGASMQNLLTETFENGIPDRRRINAMRREGLLADTVKSEPDEIREALQLCLSRTDLDVAAMNDRYIAHLEEQVASLTNFLARKKAGV